jgi:enoyl-CoA hydratase
MLTGRFIEAEEALRSGFVSRLVDDGQVEDVAFAIAEQIADNGRFATRLTKESLNATWGITSLDAAVAFENRNQVLCFTSGAPAVAIDEFRERRGRFAREGV